MVASSANKRPSSAKDANGGEEKPGRRRSRNVIGYDEPNYGPLRGYLGYQIRQAQAAVFRSLAAATADIDVTPGEYGLLTMIDANPGITQIELAAAHKLDKSTLSLAVTRLAKRGLIRRDRSLDDERANRLFLPKAGSRLLREGTRVRRSAGADDQLRSSTGRAPSDARRIAANLPRPRTLTLQGDPRPP